MFYYVKRLNLQFKKKKQFGTNDDVYFKTNPKDEVLTLSEI